MPIIEIEGLDGSGKETQVALLRESLEKLGYDVKTVGYPVYDESGYMITQYLGGAYGEDLESLNPYAMSLNYTTNRVHDYLKFWKKNYEAGDVIVADRYVGSNLIHQGSQFKSPEEAEEYRAWLYSTEVDVCGLPKADLVIFLDIPPEEQREILRSRKEQKSGEAVDILEVNNSYNEKCRDFVLGNAKTWGWHIVERSDVETVHMKILEYILPRLVYEKDPEIVFGGKSV